MNKVQILFSSIGSARAIKRRRHLIARICAVAILCSGGGVLAQTVYKLMDAAGRTTFTDRPGDGIAVPYGMLPTQESDSVLAPRAAIGTRSDLAKALSSNSPMTSLYAATVDFSEAARRLRQARQSRQDGMEPRPGERTDVGNTGAMSKRYLRRQQRLEREVVGAERRAHETSLVRSARLRRDGKTDPLKLAQP